MSSVATAQCLDMDVSLQCNEEGGRRRMMNDFFNPF